MLSFLSENKQSSCWCQTVYEQPGGQTVGTGGEGVAVPILCLFVYIISHCKVLAVTNARKKSVWLDRNEPRASGLSIAFILRSISWSLKWTLWTELWSSAVSGSCRRPPQLSAIIFTFAELLEQVNSHFNAWSLIACAPQQARAIAFRGAEE